MKKSTYMKVVIPIIVIIIAVVGAAFYFTKSTAISVIKPPGWKAYTNESHGIGFAYPGDWQEGEYPGVIAWFGDPVMGVSVSAAAESIGQMGLMQYITAAKQAVQGMYQDVSILDEGNITVSGKAGYKIIWRLESQKIYVKEMQVITLAREKAFVLTCGAPENFYESYETIFNQIVETFVIT